MPLGATVERLASIKLCPSERGRGEGLSCPGCRSLGRLDVASTGLGRLVSTGMAGLRSRRFRISRDSFRRLSLMLATSRRICCLVV